MKPGKLYQNNKTNYYVDNRKGNDSDATGRHGFWSRAHKTDTYKNEPVLMLKELYTPNSLRTFTGQFIDLINPDYQKIYPVDIAVGLSRAPRFGGHTKKPYMVSEHAMWCMQIAEEEYTHLPYLPFKVLIHDAHEYLLCDIGSPFKNLIPDYEKYATLLQNAVHRRYSVSLSKEEQEAVKAIDKKALEWEWVNKVLRWTGLLLDDKSRIDLFIHHFVRLCKAPHVLQP